MDKKCAKPKDVDEYIATANPEAQPHLQELRALVKATIPKAVEKIWYGVPFYNYYGEMVGFSTLTSHVSFGFGSNVIADEDREALEKKGYKLGKGTLQIKFDQKVPAAAIKKIIKTKAKMNEAKSTSR